LETLFQVKSDPETGVTQPQLGNSRGSLNYILSRNKQEFKLNEEGMRKAYLTAKAFFQPWAPYQVFIPQNAFFLEKVMSGSVPKVYIGLGYNGDLEKGERVDLLDMFCWASGAQYEVSQPELVVWDASSYWALNEMNLRKVPSVLNSQTSKEVLEILVKELKTNERVQRNSDLREKYLLSILKATGVKGRILDAQDYYLNPKFQEAFQECLEFCVEKKEGDLSIQNFVGPREFNPAQRLYTPLEMAEALFLFDQEGIDFKLGPPSEQKYDALIRKLVRQNRNARYGSIWYTRPPGRKQSYLADERSVLFSDPLSVREEKLKDEPYRKWLEGVVKEFSEVGYFDRRDLDELFARVLEGVK
jgi:hypothetical protein